MSKYFNHMCLLLVFLHINIMHSSGEKNDLKIGAFNIQIFGASKMKEEGVVEVLVDIISQYDIMLIQEIRDSSGNAIEELLTRINQKDLNNQFSMKISPRLGRSSSKEQYAFFYREASGLKVDRDYVYDDGNETLNTDTNTVDTFEREPYILLFESSKTNLQRFALAGLHVAPSEAVEELQALGDVFDDIKRTFDISDVMVMGDFNADCSYVPNYKWENIPIKNNTLYTWWIEDDADTTVSNSDCAYDRFVSIGNGFKTGVVNRSAKVFRFDSVFQLNQTFSLEVSDHYPIELELSLDSDISVSCQVRECVVVTIIMTYITYLVREF